MRSTFPVVSVSCFVAMLVHGAAQAADAAAASKQDDNFTLGEVTVIGERSGDFIGDDNISSSEIWNFNVNTLTDAVKLVPGVTSSVITNGRRNEGDISVRGFDRWRVPLYIDGIRVYLPADNRIDFNRFLMPDLGEVQVRKGYVSVIDGPGAMGGLINLVTRKPTKEFEAEAQGGTSFDNSGEYQGWFGTALLGTRQEKWYAQVSATESRRDHWSLPKSFVSVGPAEDGGERNGSDTRDWRVNAKLGYTPNATDEYSLSFTKQSGEKGAPLAVDFLLPNGNVRTPTYQANNYWTWPSWDIQGGYFLSNTRFGETGYVKARLYYNEYDNALYAWDDINYNSQSLNGRFRSYYADTGEGGSLEGGVSLVPRNTTKAAVFWRSDRHSEYNFNRPTHATLSSTEPKQHNEERTWSVALENDWNAADSVDVIAGVSYDHNERTRAEEYGTRPSTATCITGTGTTCLYGQALGKDSAFNWQTAVKWRYDSNASFDLSVSSRSRFPNNFERYSTRFGTAVPNPDLGAERAVNYEIDWKVQLAPGVEFSIAGFYADVQHMIQTVIVQASPQMTQTQNVGNGSSTGYELSGAWQVSSQVKMGANFSYLHREINNPVPANLKLTGVPDYLGFAYIAWQPVAAITIQPSVELAGHRWTDLNGSATLGYQQIGKYTITGLQVSWRAVQGVEAIIGARNLFDQEYELASGFPEPGRSLFAKVRWTL